MKNSFASWNCSEKKEGETVEKLRAVIYNRCSTEEESQKDALIKQVQESKNCVAERGWQLIDVYVEAKSGTTVKGRNEYNRLYQDLERNKFDVIVIKSQDRLMRNTKDWYLFLDRMQRNKKRLFMYLEHKFYTPDDALITGIKAILAEEYSRELSKKINNAHRNRQKEGKNFVFTNRIYGLKKLPDKSIIIDEGEADMIRMIFNLSADGYGTHRSAEILYQNGYRNHKGNRLGPALIRNIIKNPIYKGTVVQNRQHYDFESKQMFKNPPSEWLVHENAVPAIVDADLFERANRELNARKQDRNRDCVHIKNNPSGKYELSGKLFCGLCGNPFYRTSRPNKNGRITEWKCRNYLQNGRKKEEKEEASGCDNIHLSEKKLYVTLEEFYREKYQNFAEQRENLLKETLTVLQEALNVDDTVVQKKRLKASLEKLAYRKNLLLEKLLDGVITDKDFKMKNRELEEQSTELKSELKTLEDHIAKSGKKGSRIGDIQEKLKNKVIEQAQVADMVENIREIDVFPDFLEIYEAGKPAGIRIPQKCSTSHRPEIEEEKKVILELMKKNPQITAGEIAKKMGVNLSRIHRRICELKKEGKISYSVPNGRGKWMIRSS